MPGEFSKTRAAARARQINGLTAITVNGGDAAAVNGASRALAIAGARLYDAPGMVRRIALLNEKGGSCKTTLTVNLGSYFAIFRRKRVLLVDLDSQGQVGKSLGMDVRS